MSRSDEREADRPPIAGEDALLRWRGEFPILERTCYLISHSLGAMPRGVEAALGEYARLWSERGVRAWGEGWWDLPRTAGDRIARILNAPPGSVGMHPNVSLAQSVVASCFDFDGKRNAVVLCEDDFPSVLYVWERQARLGARPRWIRSRPDGTIAVEDLLAAIDEETALVALSHVFYKTAFLLDPKPVVEKAHAVGALVLLDAYQSVGTAPLDVGAVPVDFVVGGSVKWLCGGPGAAYLYARPEVSSRLEPRVTGWAAHESPFSFAPPPIRYAPGASRFLTGTPAVPALYASKPGHEIVASIGVEKIREKSVRQTERLIALAEERGLPVRSPRESARRGGSVTIEVPHGAGVVAELARREVLVDWRPEGGMRISPHFYTKDEELDRFAREVSDVLETKAYARHEGGGAAY